MNLDTSKMAEYAEFLEQYSTEIVALCNEIEENLLIAVQCMDGQSGRQAARRLAQNIEVIKANVPVNEDAKLRIICALKLVKEAGTIMGR